MTKNGYKAGEAAEVINHAIGKIVGAEQRRGDFYTVYVQTVRAFIRKEMVAYEPGTKLLSESSVSRLLRYQIREALDGMEGEYTHGEWDRREDGATPEAEAAYRAEIDECIARAAPHLEGFDSELRVTKNSGSYDVFRDMEWK